MSSFVFVSLVRRLCVCATLPFYQTLNMELRQLTHFSCSYRYTLYVCVLREDKSDKVSP